MLKYSIFLKFLVIFSVFAFSLKVESANAGAKSQGSEYFGSTVNSSNYGGGYKDVIFFNDDKIETIALHKGSYILMKIWATWCPYCKQQLPAFSLLKDRYKDNPDVKFIALSIDEGGFDVVNSFFKTSNLTNLEIYHDSKKNLFRVLGLRGIPTILLLSKEGDIMKMYNGMKYLDIKYLDELFGRGNK